MIDLPLVAGSFLVAIVVGLTGMGGGALMTPMMLLFFNVPPLAAVSSDLVTSAVMKPVGGLVHLRRGTVNPRLVGWLCAGSVPTAFCGVLLVRTFGEDAAAQGAVKTALGVALLLAVAGLAVKTLIGERGGSVPAREVVVRPLPTLLVGAVGGLVVGVSSVGSGSLIIIALLALYPLLRANDLVGTDLVQAVPLVASAALGHLLFGDFRPGLTLSLLAGSIPGVYLGARLSAWAPAGVIRALLGYVLLASALKLLGVGDLAALAVLAAAVPVGALIWRFRAEAPASPENADHAPAARTPQLPAG